MLRVARGSQDIGQAAVTSFYFAPSEAHRSCQVRSPDGLWQVSVTAWKIDAEARTVSVSVTRIVLQGSPRDAPGERHGLDFDLTQFDFPLTDYTQLDDQHRFAISLFELGRESGVIKIIWFPLGYITERERPFDFKAMKDKM